MANLPETEDFAEGTYQIETSDRVIGGPGGIANKQAEQLGNRTAWLRAAIRKVIDGTTAVGKAAQLATARTLKFKGAVSGSGSYDGSADTEITLTLADSGVAAGSYTKVTLNVKGLVTGGSNPTTLAGMGITDAQPLDSDLTALAALTTTGFYVNTGIGTVAARSLVAGSGISVSNSDGVAGNPTLTNTGLLSAIGTANQVVASTSNGTLTLSLPQSIHTGATPSFAQLSLGADPTSAMHSATKQYVDNLISGLDIKSSVLVATTANITLSGAQTVDGVAVTAGARVLVKNQSVASQNGIYTCAAGAWSRAVDADIWSELVSAFVFVERGSQNADTGWVCTIDPGGTLGSTAVTLAQFSGAGTVTAGAGISVVGNQVSLSVSGVAAGAYLKVTVDQYGRVTAGASLAASDIPGLDWGKIVSGKPTTLSEYGITDGCTKTQYEDLLALVNDPWNFHGVGTLVAHLDNNSVPAPRRDSPNYRYIRLTAGESYNSGALTSESVSGTAPQIQATAVVSLAGSLFNGLTIRLINTERRSLRAGLPGVIEQDAFQGHSLGDPRLSDDYRLSTPTGNNATWGTGADTGTVLSRILAGNGVTPLVIKSDGTNGTPRIGVETRVKSLGATYYLRVK